MRNCLRKLRSNPAVLILHLSFLLIIAGALCTCFFGQKGMMRLYPEEKVSEFYSSDGKIHPLPVVMELDSFKVEYYDGSQSPRDYLSYLKVDGEPHVISMNKILETDGYRFCQAGYDYDGSTFLSVNHDPIGITLVYTGYLAFAFSGLCVLLSRRGRWKNLLRSRYTLSVSAFPLMMTVPESRLYVLDYLSSDLRMLAESLYDKIPFTIIICVVLFAGATLSFLAISDRKQLKRGSDILLWLATAFSATYFILQWIMSNNIPLSDSHETLLFAVLMTELLLLLFRGQGYFFRGTAMILAAAMTMVAYLIESGSSEGPIQPVLNSPWLSFHVSLAMASYALFGLTFAAAAVAFIRPSSLTRMRGISLSVLYPAEWLLGLGIITGSVWANISWGSYWSWDPKETLALITFLIYSVPLHPDIKFLHSPRNFHLYMILGILAVAATYFGVNLLPSLHSYK